MSCFEMRCGNSAVLVTLSAGGNWIILMPWVRDIEQGSVFLNTRPKPGAGSPATVVYFRSSGIGCAIQKDALLHKAGPSYVMFRPRFHVFRCAAQQGGFVVGHSAFFG